MHSGSGTSWRNCGSPAPRVRPFRDVYKAAKIHDLRTRNLKLEPPFDEFRTDASFIALEKGLGLEPWIAPVCLARRRCDPQTGGYRFPAKAWRERRSRVTRIAPCSTGTGPKNCAPSVSPGWRSPRATCSSASHATMIAWHPFSNSTRRREKTALRFSAVVGKRGNGKGARNCCGSWISCAHRLGGRRGCHAAMADHRTPPHCL